MKINFLEVSGFFASEIPYKTCRLWSILKFWVSKYENIAKMEHFKKFYIKFYIKFYSSDPQISSYKFFHKIFKLCLQGGRARAHRRKSLSARDASL